MKNKGPNKIGLIALIVANLIPLIGVIYLDWNIFMILLLYWIESIVVGIYNIPKILIAEGSMVYWTTELKKVKGKTVVKKNIKVYDPSPSKRDKRFYAGFFVIHFMGFMAMLGVGIFGYFRGSIDNISSIFIAVAALFGSHGISFLLNYIGAGEYKNRDPYLQMFAPYKRLLVMLAVIAVTGLILKSRVESEDILIWGLILLVSLKIIADIFSHYWEHWVWTKRPDTKNLKKRGRII
ncbi:MAG: DUF6498-containing protein [Parcubacteria group bacterium]